MIAATTKSTGMTSTVPSGTPGNSREEAATVRQDHRLGHAKPRIHPGRGSAHADSMIDGLTMLTGTAPRESISACSPSALVKA